MAGELDFEELVARHYGALYRFAVSLARTESDAGDLVQETFLAWAAKGSQLREPAKARSWLFTTLHREHLQRQRRITRFPEIEVGDAEAELPAVEPALVESLDAEAALALLNRVEEPFRAAVALFYLEDYSHPEIAEILGVPLGTVKSRIARGLNRLKQMVAGDEPGVAPEGGAQP
jgi:RNA polymerase sigma-70 factor (ECF subfamily)